MDKNTKKQQVILYMHAGSENHGCEAIANSISHMIEKPILLTYYAEEDSKYSLPELCDIVQERSFSKHKLMHVIYYIYRKLTKDKESFIRYRYGELLSKRNQRKKYPVAVSIGGDNYCYDMMLNDLFLSNAAFNRQGTGTVLLGCSIEPEILKRNDVLEDLKKYELIIARESISYDAISEALGKSTEVICLPDPAFALGVKCVNLPDCFKVKNTVGINISPMIRENEKQDGITIRNYKSLIEYILNNTDMSVALIPHVVWKRNDDRKAISELFDQLESTDRVMIIEDHSCEELKYIISQCRFFVGARTHSTIAAYSTCVPTLVVGYSVKARGIARDLFGTEDGYVLPVQGLTEDDEIRNAFIALMEKEQEVTEHLKRVIPQYKEKALQNGTEILKLLNT